MLIQLRRYEEQKRLGRVNTQKPVEFNPNRYVSVRTYENVKLNQPISEQQFQTEISRVRRFWSYLQSIGISKFQNYGNKKILNFWRSESQ